MCPSLHRRENADVTAVGGSTAVSYNPAREAVSRVDSGRRASVTNTFAQQKATTAAGGLQDGMLELGCFQRSMRIGGVFILHPAGGIDLLVILRAQGFKSLGGMAVLPAQLVIARIGDHAQHPAFE